MRVLAILLLAGLLLPAASADHTEPCQVGDLPCLVENADRTVEHQTEDDMCETPDDGIEIFGVRDCY